MRDDSTQVHGDWRTNYSSVRDHEAQVEKQYDEEVKEGLMERITLGEALERYDEKLVIAATGAIAKKGAEPGATSVSSSTARTGCTSTWGSASRTR